MHPTLLTYLPTPTYLAIRKHLLTYLPVPPTHLPSSRTQSPIYPSPCSDISTIPTKSSVYPPTYLPTHPAYSSV
jgi:hypothetical protein